MDRDFFTLEQAAAKASGKNVENVSPVDLLQDARRGGLQLSIEFIEPVQAYRGRFVADDWETDKNFVPPAGANTVDADGRLRFVLFDTTPTHLAGVYDLPMWGQEKNIILNELLTRQGRATVSRWKTVGTLVTDPENPDSIYRLKPRLPAMFPEQKRNPAWYDFRPGCEIGVRHGVLMNYMKSLTVSARKPTANSIV
mgnify:CR=1 FL=1